MRQPLKTINIGLDARMLDWSGIGRYLENLIRQFAQQPAWFKNKQLLLFVLPTAPTWLRELAQRYDFLELIITRAKPFSLAEQFILPFLIKKHRLALFHSPQFNVPLLSRAWQITTVHDLAYDRFPEEFSHFFKKIYYKLMFALALRKSAQIIAVSDSTKQDLIDLRACPDKKIRVIYEGVDAPEFNVSIERSALAKRLSELGISQPYFLYVGINRPRKNLARLLRAFKLFVAQTQADIRLVLVGAQDKRFLDIDKQIVSLGLTSQVVQTGRVSQADLVLLYQGALAFVFPSLYEGFGLPALEAMAAGVPVIASQGGSLAEVVGGAGLLVDPKRPESIAQGLKKIFKDPKLRQSLIGAGRKQVQKFSWEKAAKQTLESYDDSLQKYHKS